MTVMRRWSGLVASVVAVAAMVVAPQVAYAAGGKALSYSADVADGGQAVAVVGSLRCVKSTTVSLKILVVQAINASSPGQTQSVGRTTVSGLRCTDKTTDWTATVPVQAGDAPFEVGRLVLLQTDMYGPDNAQISTDGFAEMLESSEAPSPGAIAEVTKVQFTKVDGEDAIQVTGIMRCQRAITDLYVSATAVQDGVPTPGGKTITVSGSGSVELPDCAGPLQDVPWQIDAEHQAFRFFRPDIRTTIKVNGTVQPLDGPGSDFVYEGVAAP